MVSGEAIQTAISTREWQDYRQARYVRSRVERGGCMGSIGLMPGPEWVEQSGLTLIISRRSRSSSSGESKLLFELRIQTEARFQFVISLRAADWNWKESGK